MTDREDNIIVGYIIDTYVEEKQVFCDVRSKNRLTSYSEVLVPARFKMESLMPEVGDAVAIKRADERIWLLDCVISKSPEEMPEKLEEGEWVLRPDEDTEVHIEPKDSGEHDVHLKASGDIHVSAEGDVVIDEGGEAKKVATEDHTHEYSWTDSGGDGITEPPDDITEVEIE